MNFKVGDKIMFKLFDIIKRLDIDENGENSFHGIGNFSEIHQKYKNRILTCSYSHCSSDQSDLALQFKEDRIQFFYPKKWFIHSLKPKINKLLKI